MSREPVLPEVALRALLEHAALAIAIFDAELRATHVNAALAEQLGIEPRDLIGRTIPEVLPGLAIAHEILTEVRATGRPVLGARPEGVAQPERPPMRWQADYFPLVRDDGSVGGVIGIGVREA
jgi:PAS domain-containing protein